MRKIQVLSSDERKSSFEKWYAAIRDKTARRKVFVAITRLACADYGNFRSVGEGIYELRIFYGPGYRIYFAFLDIDCIVLIGGGIKNSQRKDIYEAKKLWQKYKNEIARPRRDFFTS